MLEHHLGAVHVGLDGVDRLLDDELHADGRREVEDHVAPVDHLRQQRFVGDRVDRVGEVGAALQVRDVLDRPGGQVVEDEHLVAAARGAVPPGASRRSPRRR